MCPTRGLTASPGEEVEWHCPYCQETRSTLREIQTHITDSTDGAHEGISGESPDEDIIATNSETGEEVDIYQSSDVVRPKDATLQGISKRRQIVYAWLANDREEDAYAITTVTEADRDYVVQILGDIRRGEITRDYWSDDQDRQLLAVFEERLEKHYDQRKTTNNIEAMSTQSQQKQIKPEEELEDVSAKDLVLNTYDLTGKDLNRKKAWEALSEAGLVSTGYEYFRRTFKEAIDGQYDVEEAVNEQIQSVIEPVLLHAGVLDSGEVEVDEDVVVMKEPEEVEEEASTSKEQPASTRTSRPSGAVSVEGLHALRDRVDLLRRQVEFEAEGTDSREYRKAMFIAEETIDGIDDLIERAE